MSSLLFWVQSYDDFWVPAIPIYVDFYLKSLKTMVFIDEICWIFVTFVHRMKQIKTKKCILQA